MLLKSIQLTHFAIFFSKIFSLHLELNFCFHTWPFALHFSCPWIFPFWLITKKTMPRINSKTFRSLWKNATYKTQRKRNITVIYEKTQRIFKKIARFWYVNNWRFVKKKLLIRHANLRKYCNCKKRSHHVTSRQISNGMRFRLNSWTAEGFVNFLLYNCSIIILILHLRVLLGTRFFLFSCSDSVRLKTNKYLVRNL